MERIDVLATQPWVVDEHLHRYRFVAQYARGRVLDIACGTGYGASILTTSPQVTAYQGVDISPEAISTANERLAAAPLRIATRFDVGNITDVNAESAAFDTIVCLETLEHLRDPRPALCELKRVAAPDARIIISVPDSVHEAVCESAYGPNEFHFTKFTSDSFRSLLEESFGAVRMFRGFYGVSSVIGPADHFGGYLRFDPFPPSYLIALCGISKGSSADVVSKANVFAGMSLAAYDEMAMKPLYKTIADMNAHIEEILSAYKKSELMIDDRDREILARDKVIVELREKIEALTQNLSKECKKELA